MAQDGRIFEGISAAATRDTENIIVTLGIIGDDYFSLRPVGMETTLLVGCGNRPAPSEIPGEEDDHDHTGVVTLDPNILMNPTIVALFGESRALLAAFGGRRYNRIVFEGVVPSGEHLIYLVENLLAVGGRIGLIGGVPREFTLTEFREQYG